jgi:hypothetical protein
MNQHNEKNQEKPCFWKNHRSRESVADRLARIKEFDDGIYRHLAALIRHVDELSQLILKCAIRK